MIDAVIFLWHVLLSSQSVYSSHSVGHEPQLHTAPQLCACVQHFPVPLCIRQFCWHDHNIGKLLRFYWNCLWFSLYELQGALWASSCYPPCYRFAKIRVIVMSHLKQRCNSRTRHRSIAPLVLPEKHSPFRVTLVTKSTASPLRKLLGKVPLLSVFC
jgi:hypothetical protein